MIFLLICNIIPKTEHRPRQPRLAVELHDSLSQTLTGVALQIDAIAMAAEQDPSRVADYVDNARRTVDNCRSELKNCLWDLRSQSLDDSNAAEALRKTVSPQAGDATVTIDFAIPRSHFTDLTFHDVLRIVRELVTNAVRHGKARNIVLSGTDDGQTVRVSVRDDGCGFDPSARLGIADDHAVVRTGLKTLLGFQRDFSVIGEAADGDEAVDKATRLKPDILLLDIMMPGSSGIDVARHLRQTTPDVKILVLTSSSSSNDLAQILKTGVDGVLMKSAPNEDLIAAIRAVADGQQVVPREIRQMAAEANENIRPLTLISAVADFGIAA